MKLNALVAGVVVLVGGCSHRPAATDASEAELLGPAVTVVSFRTPDGWTIRGDFQSPPGAKRAVVLLHQRDGRARDWAPLTARLAKAGIATLALDARGVGRSQREGSSEDAPWDTTGDIAGAVSWLQTRGFAPEKVGLAGASYGANNVLLYAARTPKTPAIALLSPGANYHGLDIRQAAFAFKGPLLLVYAREDPITNGGPELIVKARNGAIDSAAYAGSNHGTDIFGGEPGSLNVLTAFFDKRLPAK